MKKLSKFVSSLKKFLSLKFNSVNKRRKVYTDRFLDFAKEKPITAFVAILLVLLVLILLSNFISKPNEQSTQTNLPTKEVEVYTIGTSPKITVEAQVEKSGVVKIVALGAGVVQAINAQVGQPVGRGETLVSMSTNYQGGNAMTVQRQLAQVQFTNAASTYKENKEIISKQRELANKADENADKLRDISNQSVDATNDIINLNNEMLSGVDAQIALAESKNDVAAIATYKGMKAQLLSANNQLQQAVRNTVYAGDSNNPPAQISDITKDIANKQLDIQEKALGLSLEVSRLNLALAQITEALMYPSAPFSGVVERVYVKVGQAVNPGTPLVQLSGNSDSLKAVALLSREMAQGVSTSQVSTLHFGNDSVDLAPFYISTEATDGQLYTAEYSIPQEYSSKITDKSYITIEIPMGAPKTSAAVPFVPLDSVFQTQDQAYLFVAKNGKAVSRKVKLGSVLGRFVEIESGLNNSDQVILDRNVIDGDSVKIKN